MRMFFLVFLLAPFQIEQASAQSSGFRWHVQQNGALLMQGGEVEEVCEYMLGRIVSQYCGGDPTAGEVDFLYYETTANPNIYSCVFETLGDVCSSAGSGPGRHKVGILKSTAYQCELPSRFRTEPLLGISPAPAPKCDIQCESPYELNSDTGTCQEPPDQCDECGDNPINFSTGKKYRVEMDYVGSGSFPLRLERRYNSQGNKQVSSHGLTSDVVFPTVGGAPTTTYTTPAVATRYGFRLYSARVFADQQSQLGNYNGNVANKWRHYYERHLVASFEESVINPNEVPSVINIYRYDGEKESYSYSEGEYRPENSYGSKITRLDSSHALAPGWHVVNGDNEIEIYDLAGKLLRVSAASGLSHHLSYDSVYGTQLETVTDDFGNSLIFHREDTTNPTRISRITDPDGHDYLYSYTDRGLIEAVVYPDLTPADPNDNPQRIYLYGDVRFPDGLTEVVDENGDILAQYEYDETGSAISTELGQGAARTEVVYDYVGNTRTIVNELGLETTFSLSALGLVQSALRGASTIGAFSTAIQTFSYDTNGYGDSEVDWNGIQIQYTHNLRGLETSRTEAVGTPQERTIATEWHPTLRLPILITEPGRTTAMTYDSNGNMLTRTETDSVTNASRTWTYTYYPEGVNGALQIATMDGPRTDISDVTTYTYTASGFVASITNPLGHVTQVTSYNSRGLPQEMIDANNVITQMSYHPRGWLLTSTVFDPTGAGNRAATVYAYDNVGQMTQVTLPSGVSLNYEYDAAHRLIAISNNLGERQEYTLDTAGNITVESIKDSSGIITRTQQTVYDELSRVHQTIGGEGQTTQRGYDSNGNETSLRIDPNGLNQTTLQAFDALNRLHAVTDAQNGVSEYVYDARDNLIAVTDQRGLVTTYTYDGLNNLLQLNNPDTGITVYAYDDAGNQLSQTDARGVVTNYAYDALNRLTAVTYPGSPAENISYVYDQPASGFGKGHLSQLNDQTGSTSYIYDHRGNQLQSSVTILGNTYTTSYVYDLADNLTQTVYPSGRIVNHQLDTLGRTATVTTQQNGVATAQTVASAIEYLPFGSMQELRYGNDLNLSIDIDQDYRITALAVQDAGGSGPDILNLTFMQNAVDNITAITDAVDANRSQAFIYDQLNRLLSADGSYGVQNFTYDPVGNRLTLSATKGASTTVETYTYDTSSNRLLSVDVDGQLRTFQYDSNGNIIGDDRGADTGFTLEYNNQNRLIEATPSSQGAR